MLHNGKSEKEEQILNEQTLKLISTNFDTAKTEFAPVSTFFTNTFSFPGNFC